MKTTTFISLLGACAAMASSAAAAATPQPEVVWSPKITSPTNKTVWYHNTPENVTWSTVGAPSLISNKFSVVLDGKVLASGFDPLAGFVTVVVNTSLDIPAGKYQLTLFGDSGNKSPLFTLSTCPYCLS